jgi:hypothetical protein
MRSFGLSTPKSISMKIVVPKADHNISNGTIRENILGRGLTMATIGHQQRRRKEILTKYLDLLL